MKIPILRRNKRKGVRIETPIITEDEPVPEVQPYSIDFVRSREKPVDAIVDWYVECQEKAGVDMEWFKGNPTGWLWVVRELLKKHGIHDVLSCITWMSGPHCKYYQYPFSLMLVKKTIEEFLDLKEKGLLELKYYRGFLGELVNVKELEAPVSDG